MKEVYRSEKSLVCNVFNQFYVAFHLQIMAQYAGSFPGMAMNAVGLREIVKNEDYLIEYTTSLSEKDREDMLFILSEETFAHFLSNKEKFAQKPMTDDVDLDFEQELLLKGKDALG